MDQLPMVKRLPERGKFYINALALRMFHHPSHLKINVEGKKVEVRLAEKNEGSRVSTRNIVSDTPAWLLWESSGLPNTQRLYLRRYVDEGDDNGKV